MLKTTNMEKTVLKASRKICHDYGSEYLILLIINIIKILPILVYRHNTILITLFFVENWQKDPKVYMEIQVAPNC